MSRLDDDATRDPTPRPTDPGNETLDPDPTDRSGVVTARATSSPDATSGVTSACATQTANLSRATEAIRPIIAGKYTLVEMIGEGGMGSVYLAEQTEPVRRQVAVKLIKAGMDSKAVLGRFDAERQALAMMDHPNIARVFDGGSTPAGQPFFVMEFVRGVPITQYCDEHRLSPNARLELYVQITISLTSFAAAIDRPTASNGTARRYAP